MATSHDHSSSMERPTQLYQPAALGHGRSFHPPPPLPPVLPALPMYGSLCESTVVTTTSSSSTSNGTTQPGVEGRVVKPARRRSRASRRVPTTLLNTDTTNFRAMVQQFTGIPSGPYSASYPAAGGPIASYGISFDDSQAHNPNPNPMLMPYGQVLQQQQQQRHPYIGQELQYHRAVPQQQFQSSSQGIFGSLGVGVVGSRCTNNVDNDSKKISTSGSDDAFLLGFNNSCINLESADGFYFDGTPTSRPTSTNTRTDGFFS